MNYPGYIQTQTALAAPGAIIIPAASFGIQYATGDPCIDTLNQLDDFSIDNTSEGGCCKAINTYKVYWGLPATLGLEKSKDPFFYTLSETLNCGHDKFFDISLMPIPGRSVLQLPFLRVMRTSSCFTSGDGYSAKILDIRGGQQIELGEIQKSNGCCSYSILVFIAGKLAFNISAGSCDCSLPCNKCTQLQFTINTVPSKEKVGGFVKVRIIEFILCRFGRAAQQNMLNLIIFTENC